MGFSLSPKKIAQKILGLLSWLLNGEREGSPSLCPVCSRVMKVGCAASLSSAWRGLGKIYPSETS